MKQFVLVKSLLTSGDVNTLNDGQAAFVKKNSVKATQDFTDYNGEFNLAVKEGNYINMLPIHTNKLTFNISPAVNATTFKTKITFNAGLYPKGSYTMIIAKKGVPFNERNKWTATTYMPTEGNYADIVANDLANYINKLGFVKATYTTSNHEFVVEATEAGVDYTVIVTDNFNAVNPTVEVVTKGAKAQNDVAAIVDLYEKCAADRGINYTYKDADIYPSMPFSPLKGSSSGATMFNVVNIRFAEPRVTKTTDEVVNQMVHIAIPNDQTSVLTNIETILSKLGTKEFVELDETAAQTNLDEIESPVVE